MGQVHADMRLDRTVENLEPAELEGELAAADTAAREVIAYAESRGFRATWARVVGGHEETLADRHADTVRDAESDYIAEKVKRVG